MELHEILSTLREEKDMKQHEGAEKFTLQNQLFPVMKQVPASLHILFLLRLLTYMTLV